MIDLALIYHYVLTNIYLAEKRLEGLKLKIQTWLTKKPSVQLQKM